jgi:hypothetical protein
MALQLLVQGQMGFNVAGDLTDGNFTSSIAPSLLFIFLFTKPSPTSHYQVSARFGTVIIKFTTLAISVSAVITLGSKLLTLPSNVLSFRRVS